MSDASRRESPEEQGRDFDLSRSVRRVVLLGFAIIQLVLVARILLDLGVLPEGGRLAEFVTVGSDALAAPVQRVGSIFGGMFGSIGGLNVTMLVALAGWSVVEGLVMRVVRKFDAI